MPKHILLRILLALTVVSLARFFCYFGQDTFRVESSYGSFHNSSSRTKGWFRQIDSFNQGRYLEPANDPGGSFTRENPDDVGMYVCLANLGVARKLWRGTRPAWLTRTSFLSNTMSSRLPWYCCFFL